MRPLSAASSSSAGGGGATPATPTTPTAAKATASATPAYPVAKRQLPATTVGGRFSRMEHIGRGSFGQVFKGINLETNELVAIKVLKLDTDDDDLEEMRKEISALSKCDSEYIVRYYGSFLNETELWIVMDFCGGGSVRSLLKSGKIHEKYIAIIAREVAMGLSYLHKNNIIHRDIKAANVLLTSQGQVKLCDFGVAGAISMNTLRRNSFVGTPYWMAPEVITRSAYDFKADIWSFGITVYEIATGNPPLAELDPIKALFLIPKSTPARLDEARYSKTLREFVALCLNDDPKERPSADDLLKTRFLRSAKKSIYLTELVSRHNDWKANGGHDLSDTEINFSTESGNGSVSSEHASGRKEDTVKSGKTNWDFSVSKAAHNQDSSAFPEKDDSVEADVISEDEDRKDIMERSKNTKADATDELKFASLRRSSALENTKEAESKNNIDGDSRKDDSTANTENNTLPTTFSDSKVRSSSTGRSPATPTLNTKRSITSVEANETLKEGSSQKVESGVMYEEDKDIGILKFQNDDDGESDVDDEIEEESSSDLIEDEEDQNKTTSASNYAQKRPKRAYSTPQKVSLQISDAENVLDSSSSEIIAAAETDLIDIKDDHRTDRFDAEVSSQNDSIRTSFSLSESGDRDQNPDSSASSDHSEAAAIFSARKRQTLSASSSSSSLSSLSVNSSPQSPPQSPVPAAESGTKGVSSRSALDGDSLKISKSTSPTTEISKKTAATTISTLSRTETALEMASEEASMASDYVLNLNDTRELAEMNGVKNKKKSPRRQDHNDSNISEVMNSKNDEDTKDNDDVMDENTDDIHVLRIQNHSIKPLLALDTDMASVGYSDANLSESSSPVSPNISSPTSPVFTDSHPESAGPPLVVSVTPASNPASNPTSVVGSGRSLMTTSASATSASPASGSIGNSSPTASPSIHRLSLSPSPLHQIEYMDSSKPMNPKRLSVQVPPVTTAILPTSSLSGPSRSQSATVVMNSSIDTPTSPFNNSIAPVNSTTLPLRSSTTQNNSNSILSAAAAAVAAGAPAVSANASPSLRSGNLQQQKQQLQQQQQQLQLQLQQQQQQSRRLRSTSASNDRFSVSIGASDSITSGTPTRSQLQQQPQQHQRASRLQSLPVAGNAPASPSKLAIPSSSSTVKQPVKVFEPDPSDLLPFRQHQSHALAATENVISPISPATASVHTLTLTGGRSVSSSHHSMTINTSSVSITTTATAGASSGASPNPVTAAQGVMAAANYSSNSSPLNSRSSYFQDSQNMAATSSIAAHHSNLHHSFVQHQHHISPTGSASGNSSNLGSPGTSTANNSPRTQVLALQQNRYRESPASSSLNINSGNLSTSNNNTKASSSPLSTVSSSSSSTSAAVATMWSGVALDKEREELLERLVVMSEETLRLLATMENATRSSNIVEF